MIRVKEVSMPRCEDLLADGAPKSTKRRRLNRSLDLDRSGASCWMYPGADGQYKFASEQLASPAHPKTPMKPKDILKEFDLSPRRRRHFALFNAAHSDANNDQSQDFSYRSNIADIVRSAKVVCTPKLESRREESAARYMSPEYSKPRLAGFPRGVFQVPAKSKRLFA